MAFTGAEFFRGAVSAWVWSMLLTVLVWTVCTGGIGFVAVVFVVPTATVATVVCAVLAWGLGRSLRRIRLVSIHILAFAVLGALVGCAATTAWILTDRGAFGMSETLYPINGLCGAAAVILGWHSAARHALGWSSPLRRPASRSHAELDTAIDDGLETRQR